MSTWRGIYSYVSQESLPTRHGRLTHGNGRLKVGGWPDPVYTFWFHELPSGLVRNHRKGSAGSYSYAEFNVEAIERYIDSIIDSV